MNTVEANTSTNVGSELCRTGDRHPHLPAPWPRPQPAQPIKPLLFGQRNRDEDAIRRYALNAGFGPPILRQETKMIAFSTLRRDTPGVGMRPLPGYGTRTR